MTRDELINFEREIADLFNSGAIRAPVHLSGGCEDQLIEIFQDVKQDDWVCSTWRSHYHCLLKGVPPEEVKSEILAGRSITLCFPKYRVVTSAIVGGILPIALGLALGIKRAGGSERVHVFVGDMTALSGIFHECEEYARGFNLPIMFIMEDNGKSVCTDTQAVWGRADGEHPTFRHITYDLPWPHSGSGTRVNF